MIDARSFDAIPIESAYGNIPRFEFRCIHRNVGPTMSIEFVVGHLYICTIVIHFTIRRTKRFSRLSRNSRLLRFAARLSRWDEKMRSGRNGPTIGRGR